MALSSTIFTFDIDVADSDRGVYEHLDLRVARHPSESNEFLVARVLAYCLEYTDGIEFSRGLCDADDPPIAVRDLTGAMQAWIDIGTPSADRLHRASKTCPRVVVYVHKDPTQWLASIAAARIHRADELELRLIDRHLVRDLAAVLERRMSFALATDDGEVFVSLGPQTLTGRVRRIPL
jgi:uncharacterized protein YaeQ